MHDHRDEPQVRGDRRLQREERQDPVVELEVDPVDLVVARDDTLRPVVVVLDHRLHGVVDGVTGEFAEREQLQLHLVELLVEVRARHQPNRPVT